MATASLPSIQFHIGATGGIGVQQAVDQGEEVQQPAFGQGAPDAGSSIPFAQRFIVDVGMGDRFIGGRGIRVEGYDSIRGLVSQAPPIQPDLEPPQIDALQRHRLGGHAQLLFGKVAFDLELLVLQGQ